MSGDYLRVYDLHASLLVTSLELSNIGDKLIRENPDLLVPATEEQLAEIKEFLMERISDVLVHKDYPVRKEEVETVLKKALNRVSFPKLD